jgi:hypothetical protein
VIGLVLAVVVAAWVFRPGQQTTPEEVANDVQSRVMANLEETPVDGAAEAALVAGIRRDGRADDVVAGPDEQGHRVWIDRSKQRIYVALCSVGEPLVALGAKYGGGVMLDSNPDHVTKGYDLTCIVPNQ